jgi:8-oxo-dGTP diphosphatase
MHSTFPVTIHLFLFRNEQILLTKRYQTGYMDGYFSVPAGHLEGQETVNPMDMDFAGVSHRNEGDERVDFFFRIRNWVGEPINAEPAKCDELLWVDYLFLPENTIPYIQRAIQNFQNGILYDEFGWK